MRQFGYSLVLPLVALGLASCISKDTNLHAGSQEVDRDADTDSGEGTGDGLADGSETDESDTDEGTDESDTDESDDETTDGPNPDDDDEPVEPAPSSEPSEPGPSESPPDAAGPDAASEPAPPEPAPSPSAVNPEEPSPEPSPTTPVTPSPSPTTPTTSPTPTMTPTAPVPVPEPEGCGGSFSVSADGHVRAPSASGTCWSGQAFAKIDDSGSTVSPRTFESCGENCQLCISGTIAWTVDYSGYAAVGFGVTEGIGPGSSFVVDVTNRTASPLRVNMTGIDGRIWCRDISGTPAGSITVQLSEFNTRCWDGNGDAYAGESILEISLIVPGRGDFDVPYDICLDSITPP